MLKLCASFIYDSLCFGVLVAFIVLIVFGADSILECQKLIYSKFKLVFHISSIQFAELNIGLFFFAKVLV